MFNPIKILIKNKNVVLVLVLLLILIAWAATLGLGMLTHPSRQFDAFTAWLKHNNVYISLWHIALMLAIYFGWEYRVEHHLAKMTEKPREAVIRQTKQFRWVLIIAVWVISFLAHL